MRTAPVKAIVLPAVHRANLECQLHVPFQHSRTRVIDSRMCGRRGFCTLVHSLIQYGKLFHNMNVKVFVCSLSHVMELLPIRGCGSCTVRG